MTTPNYEYYGMLAEFWDLFRGDTSTWEDRFFFLDVVKRYGQPVLDVGCGTGRIVLDFMQQGIDIEGVDNSPDMLARLRRKADKLDLKPTIYQQEMTELSLPRKYQTILVPSSSFQLLLDASLPPLAMKRFYEHLPSGGVLAMPFMTLWHEAAKQAGVSLEALRHGGRSVRIVEARDDFIRRAVWEGGHRAVAVAAFLGCHASNISRALQKKVLSHKRT